jgi:transcriptional regulator with XRE-family HTH domain
MSIVSDNLQTILRELNMSQIKFAESVGTSFGYLNMVVNNRRTSISRQLALLIQEKYEYSADWLLHNVGAKKINHFKNSKAYEEIRNTISQLSFEEMNHVCQYVLSLEEKEKHEKQKRNLKKQNRRSA